MDVYSPLGCFTMEWTSYLEMHGHRVKQQPDDPAVLLSRGRGGQRYRWLLRCVEAESLLLTVIERKCIRHHFRLARRRREQCFLAVKFGHPAGTAVVAPVAQALKMRRLSQEKGGIPWDERGTQEAI